MGLRAHSQASNSNQLSIDSSEDSSAHFFKWTDGSAKELCFCRSRETYLVREATGGQGGWQFAVNMRNSSGKATYRFGVKCRSCGKHVLRCFGRAVYSLLWLLESQRRSWAVCFNRLAYFSGKPK
jgi:hypothetical protein